MPARRPVSPCCLRRRDEMRDASEGGMKLGMRWEAKARHAGARQESHSPLHLMSSSELSSMRCGWKGGWGGWEGAHSPTFTPHSSPTPGPMELGLGYVAAGTAGSQPAARRRRSRPRRHLPETSVCGWKGGRRVVACERSWKCRSISNGIPDFNIY